MASSSSSSWRYDVFPSFSGEDVRISFLSHLLEALRRKSIDTFIDNSIERSLPIDPALLLAIKESKISIVIFSKNYASSTWCLNELVAIHKCFRELKQMVIPIFYDVVPSDVRKQTREFGKLFKETCKGQPEDHKQRWMEALSDVAKRPGYVVLNGDNEANMIKKIARDVSEKLNNWCSTGLAFLIVINLLLEIASAVVEHLSSIRKPYLARISVVMSFLSIVLSILDFFYKIRAHKARFRCKWPIPWFYYYPAHGYNRIFGNFTDTVLLCCAVGGFIVSTVNWSFIEKRREGPIKASVWPLFFAIGLFGMVVYKFFQEKLAISKDNYTLDDILIDRFED